ncbi:MAG: ABC transporter permease, partial [Candidatus Tectomicrobia bacterium]
MFLQRAQYWSLKLLSLYSITLAVFVFPHLIPGSPLTLYASWPITPQQQEQLTREYGFDRPLPSQYVIWLQRLLSGEWGTSRYYGRSVLPATGRATGLTLILLLWTILASCLWYALLRGLRRILPSSSSPAHPTWLFPVAAALPNFLIAIILRDVFIWQLGWISMANLPSFAPNYLLQPMYMLLPASVLALTLLLLWQACDNKTPAILALSRRYRMRLHVAQFCVSFRPLLAGFLLEVLLIEFVFSLPGLGKFGIAALRRRDFPALQGFLLSTAGLYFVLQLVLDWGTHLPPRASALLAPAPHPKPRASSRRS